MCQIYLQVRTLSKITDASSKEIVEEAFAGKKLTDHFSSLKWPHQLVVTIHQRKLWQKALEAAYTSSGQILKAPLGAWKGLPALHWRNFYDPKTHPNVL